MASETRGSKKVGKLGTAIKELWGPDIKKSFELCTLTLVNGDTTQREMTVYLMVGSQIIAITPKGLRLQPDEDWEDTRPFQLKSGDRFMGNASAADVVEYSITGITRDA